MIRSLLLLSACLLSFSAQALDLNEWDDGVSQHRALALFKKRLGLDLQLHFNGELGKPPQSLEKLMGGELDMASGGLENFMPVIIDEITGLAMPFLLPDSVSTRSYLASPLMEEGREKVLHSRAIRFLVMEGRRDPSRLILSVKPVHEAADLAGLKVAVLPAPSNAGVRVWRKLGVTLVPPGPLAPGKLDAIVTSSVAKLPAGTRYVGEIHDHPDLWTIAIRESLWQGWSPAQRDAAMAAAAEAGKVMTRQGETERAALLKQARRGKVEVGQVDSLSIHRGLEPLYTSFIEYGDINPRVLQAAQAAIGP